MCQRRRSGRAGHGTRLFQRQRFLVPTDTLKHPAKQTPPTHHRSTWPHPQQHHTSRHRPLCPVHPSPSAAQAPGQIVPPTFDSCSLPSELALGPSNIPLAPIRPSPCICLPLLAAASSSPRLSVELHFGLVHSLYCFISPSTPPGRRQRGNGLRPLSRLRPDRLDSQLSVSASRFPLNTTSAWPVRETRSPITIHDCCDTAPAVAQIMLFIARLKA